MVEVLRHRTAMSRSALSRPMALAFDDGVLNDEASVFDYGCGRGGDVRRLRQLGITASGWDPSHNPHDPLVEADVVNLGYVINVIEDKRERQAVVAKAWSLARRALVVSARLAWEAREVRGRPHGDGVITGKDTFQKFYEQDELRSYLESTLSGRAIAAAPGIFYMFKEEQAAHDVLARRARRACGDHVARVGSVLYELFRDQLAILEAFVESERRLPKSGELEADVEATLVNELGSVRAAFALVRRMTGVQRWTDIDAGRQSVSERRFDEHRSLLEALMEFVEDRGRIPMPDEITFGAEVEDVFGSIRSAFSLVRRVTGGERWVLLEERARRNFLVYLALAAFGGRPRFSQLAADLQRDVRELFGSYKSAVVEADKLLFAVGDLAALDHACRSSEVGKLTPEALYVHVSAVGELAPMMRVYEGCGKALCGTVEDATVIKFHREKPQVSYLSYPTFDRDAHPALSTVLVARLGSLKLTYRDFRDSDNPPILHRKETFVASDYPGRAGFARLTQQEEKYELLSSGTIGTRGGWELALAEKCLEIRGHQVRRRT